MPVAGVRNAVAIKASGVMSAALLADGTVMTWGHSGGPHGRPGLPDDTPVPTPTLVPGATGIRAFAIGSEHAVGVTRTGAVVSWGNQRLGERGHPGIAPALIPGLTNVTAIEACTGATFAVLNSGAIMTLGHVPYWARLGGDPTAAPFPIPLLIKGLRNPM